MIVIRGILDAARGVGGGSTALTGVVDDGDVSEADEPSQQGQAADRVVGGAASGVAKHWAVEPGAEECLWDAAGVEAGH